MRLVCCTTSTCPDLRHCATQLKLWFDARPSFSYRTPAAPQRVCSQPGLFQHRSVHITWRAEQRASLSTSCSRLGRYRPASGRPYQPRYPSPRTETNTNRAQGNYRHDSQRRQSLGQTRAVDHGSLQERVMGQETEVERIPNTSTSTSRDHQTQAQRGNWIRHPLSTKPRTPRRLQSVELLEAELQWRARHNPHPIPIRAILLVLIRKHNIVPTGRHYEALLLSNCSPDGSSDNVRAILEEIEVAGVDLSVSVLMAALNALAIHPQPDLAARISAALEQHWSSMSSTTQHDLIACAIRLHQPELANSLLNDLHASQKNLAVVERTPVPLYLYVMFMQYLVNHKDYDAVMHFIYKLRDRNVTDMELPAALWSWVLQHSARDGDVWVSSWIWREWVEKMRVRPCRETCHHMLSIASRDRLSWLAESVRDTIEHRGVASGSKKDDSNGDLLPPNALSSDEERMLNQACGVARLRSVQDESAETVSAKGEATLKAHVRSGNMWPYFNHDSEHGSGRFDPWDALGPKARRR